MQYNNTMLTASSRAAPLQDSELTGSAGPLPVCVPERRRGRDAGRIRGFSRGLMGSRTRLSRLTGTANTAAQRRPRTSGDMAYFRRGCRTAVACARDIDMTVLPGLISSTVSGLLEMMNA
jgi:hypothetical protein